VWLWCLCVWVYVGVLCWWVDVWYAFQCVCLEVVVYECGECVGECGGVRSVCMCV